MREMSEWDDTIESEENDRLLAAILADFAANFPHVPVCEAGAPSRATPLELKISLQTHGCFATSVDKMFLAEVLANQTKGMLLTRAQFDEATEAGKTGDFVEREEGGPWPHISFYGEKEVGEDERKWGAKPLQPWEKKVQEKIALQQRSVLRELASNAELGNKEELKKQVPAKFCGAIKAGINDDEGGLKSYPQWSNDGSMVQRAQAAAFAFQKKNWDEDPIRDLLAEGLQGLISKEHAEKQLSL